MHIKYQTHHRNKSFPDRPLNIPTKLFLAMSVFISFGFIIFIISIFLTKIGIALPENLVSALFTFFKVWGILFAYVLPLGLITVGIWSIQYKEAAIKPFVNIFFPKRYFSPLKLDDTNAIITGVFYIILGLIILWTITGILVSICSTPFCLTLPQFIRFI